MNIDQITMFSGTTKYLLSFRRSAATEESLCVKLKDSSLAFGMTYEGKLKKLLSKLTIKYLLSFRRSAATEES